ncbi:DUF4268 domain-containing protein [Actinophytocola sp. NPDC049390]|uniref:DUF4268 domain-containing protein n=1 Tax=Actinophytocola sp. NPDC049390 TaxID=3363894 RepID=UPI0037B0689A
MDDSVAAHTTAAYHELCSNLDYARDLVSGGKHLQRLQVNAFDVADLYRAAWVQAVSALDHWVHRELYDRALGFALNVGEKRPPQFFNLRIPMQMFEDVHYHRSRTLQEAFAEHLRDHFGYQSFQAPEKIKQALAHVTAEPLWPNVEKQLDSAVVRLKDIVNRRNRIAHEADRDPDDGTRRLPISADDVTLAIDHVQQTATAIAVVLGRPPAVPLQPIQDEPVQVTAGLTPKQELYRRFWTEFRPVVVQHRWTKSTPPPQNWWDMPSGVGGVTWVLSYSMFGCRSELYFGHTDPAMNLARWRVLHERRDEIIACFGDGLIFDDLPNNKACRIEVRRHGPKITDQAKWPEVRRWMEDTQLRLRAAVDTVGGVPNILTDSADG